MPNDNHDEQGRFASGSGGGKAEKIGGGAKSKPRMMSAEETHDVDSKVKARNASYDANTAIGKAIASRSKKDNLAAAEAHGLASRIHARVAQESTNALEKRSHQERADNHAEQKSAHMKAAHDASRSEKIGGGSKKPARFRE